MRTAVRIAVKADLQAFRYVGFVTWPITYALFAGPVLVVDNLDEYWSREALLPAIEAGDCLVSVRGADIVGVSEVGRLKEDLVMWKLYVLPEFQGQGVGKQLLSAVIALANERGLSLVTEYIAGNNSAGAFYTAQGFQAESVPVTPMDSVWMRHPTVRRL